MTSFPLYKELNLREMFNSVFSRMHEVLIEKNFETDRIIHWY